MMGVPRKGLGKAKEEGLGLTGASAALGLAEIKKYCN